MTCQSTIQICRDFQVVLGMQHEGAISLKGALAGDQGHVLIRNWFGRRKEL
jgi:hypothetical protein